MPFFRYDLLSIWPPLLSFPKAKIISLTNKLDLIMVWYKCKRPASVFSTLASLFQEALSSNRTSRGTILDNPNLNESI